MCAVFSFTKHHIALQMISGLLPVNTNTVGVSEKTTLSKFSLAIYNKNTLKFERYVFIVCSLGVVHFWSGC